MSAMTQEKVGSHETLNGTCVKCGARQDELPAMKCGW